MCDEKHATSLWGAAILREAEPELLVFEPAPPGSPPPGKGEPASVIEAFHQWQVKSPDAYRMRRVKLQTDKAGAVIAIAVRLKFVPPSPPRLSPAAGDSNSMLLTDEQRLLLYRGTIVTYTYDGTGRLTQREEPPSEPPNDGTQA
jgi:hypothetical protein